MRVSHFETLTRIVEKGTFAGAAKALNTTQSAVSARVKELERYFGVELFNRSGHRAQLTLKGRELFEMSRDVLQLITSMRARVSDPSALSGCLRLGVVGLVAETWLPAAIERLRIDHPRLDIQIEVALSASLEQALQAGTMDMAILAGYPIADALLFEDVLIGHDAFAWMARPGLLDTDTPVEPSALRELSILAFSRASFHYPVLKAWFNDTGLAFKPALTCNRISVLADLAARGMGVALLPRDHLQPLLDTGRLCLLDVRPGIPPVPFVLRRPVDHDPMLGRIVIGALMSARAGAHRSAAQPARS